MKAILSAALCALLVACGGGADGTPASTVIDGPVTINAGTDNVLVARVQVDCPAESCTILVEQSATWTWSEPGAKSARSIIAIGGMKPGTQTPPIYSGLLNDTQQQVNNIGRSAKLDVTKGLAIVEYRVGHKSSATLTVSNVVMTAEVLQ